MRGRGEGLGGDGGVRKWAGSGGDGGDFAGAIGDWGRCILRWRRVLRGCMRLHQAAAALWRGACARAVVVAADASLYPLFEGSFERLGVLAPKIEGVRRCEPYGEKGEGFFVSEAGAALELTNLRVGELTNEHVIVEDSWIGVMGRG